MSNASRPPLDWSGAVPIPGFTCESRIRLESEEALRLESIRVDDAGVLRCAVKHAAKGGPYPARFDRHAAAALAEHLHEIDGRAVLRVGRRELAIAGA